MRLTTCSYGNNEGRGGGGEGRGGEGRGGEGRGGEGRIPRPQSPQPSDSTRRTQVMFQLLVQHSGWVWIYIRKERREEREWRSGRREEGRRDEKGPCKRIARYGRKEREREREEREGTLQTHSSMLWSRHPGVG